jgi:hypothetical protein
MEWRVVRRLAFYSLLFVLYLVSTVPVGLFLYSFKTEVGFNIFRDGGFHAYMQCLSTSFPIVKTNVAVAPAREALQRCEAMKRSADVDAPAPAPTAAPARAFEGGRRPTEMRTPEGAKLQCLFEAERLGKVASLWCAGL